MKNARNTSKGISGAAQKASRHCNPFRPNSQNAQILAILQSGKSLTHYQAAQMGIMAFTTRIHEIRAAGFPVVCRMESVKNKHGHTVKRGVFTLA
ncbi:TPA: helix-turn-helix domain-containing protein [Neisseria bacilliformis]|jgi:hypothetical protein